MAVGACVLNGQPEPPGDDSAGPIPGFDNGGGKEPDSPADGDMGGQAGAGSEDSGGGIDIGSGGNTSGAGGGTGGAGAPIEAPDAGVDGGDSGAAPLIDGGARDGSVVALEVDGSAETQGSEAGSLHGDAGP